MANDINGSLRNVLPGNIDEWNRVYATIADANAAIPSTVVGGRNFREGKVVQIGTKLSYIEHHWIGGYENYNLVPKIKSFEDITETNPNLVALYVNGILDDKGIDGNGNIIDLSGYKTLPKIPVENGVSYTISGLTSSATYGIIFWKSDGTQFNHGVITNGGLVFTPNGYSHIQFTFKVLSDAITPNVQFRKTGVVNETIVKSKAGVKQTADNLSTGAKIGTQNILGETDIVTLVDNSKQLSRTVINPNLFSPTMPGIIYDKEIISGVFYNRTGAKVTPVIPLDPNSTYEVTGLSAGAHGVIFFKPDGTVNNFGGLTVPYTFSTGVTIGSFQLTFKLMTDTVEPNPVIKKANIVSETIVKAKTGEKLQADILTAGATLGGQTITTDQALKASRIYLETDSKVYNELYEGSADTTFWSLPAGVIGKELVTPPSALPFQTLKPSIKFTAQATKSNYGIRRIVVKPTDRILYGMWLYKPVMDIAGVANAGFYGQLERTGNVVSSRILLFTKSQLNTVGHTLTATEFTAKVEVVSGDWVYISCKNNSDMPSDTLAYVVNPFITGTSTTAEYSFYIYNPSFFKNTSLTINPYVYYDNSAYIIEEINKKIANTASVSPLKNKRLIVEGDSLIEQGYITSNIVTRTGCVLVNNAKSGSGYVHVNQGTIRSRIVNIAAQTPDYVFIMAGTNDWKMNIPLGSAAVTNNDAQFYSAVYNTYRVYKEQNQTTPILVSTPLQRNYLNGEPRGAVNSLGLTLLQYANVIKEVCQIFAIQVIDLYSISGITLENLSTLTNDGLHVNSPGGRICGGKITIDLEGLIKP